MNSPSRVDREARIKATVSLFHDPGALGARREVSVAGPEYTQALGPALQVDDAPVRDVWWWAGRLLAGVAFAAALIAPWILLFANRFYPR
jgi:hypothetical protein